MTVFRDSADSVDFADFVGFVEFAAAATNVVLVHAHQSRQLYSANLTVSHCNNPTAVTVVYTYPIVRIVCAAPA